MITLLDIDKLIKEKTIVGPVTSPQLFLSNSYNFHPQGLLSEEIFGMDGTKARSTTMSWIELNCNVIHPVLYDIISKTIERQIVQLISGEKSFRLNEVGELQEDPDGNITGMTSLTENIKKLKFRNSESDTRSKIIGTLYKAINDNLFFVNKLIVVSPTYREVSVIEELHKVAVHPLTDLYIKIINQAAQLKSVHGAIFDILSYKMQLLLRDLYELIRQTVSKKQGMIRKLMLGKRVDFSGRSVITPNPNLHVGEVGLPLSMVVSLFEPNIIFGLLNSPYSGNIPEEFHIVAKDFLLRELQAEQQQE